MNLVKYSGMELSPHFNQDEFDCRGEDCCKETLVSNVLIERLEELRLAIDRPITVTSGYRCDKHNKRVGGSLWSMHRKGMAADIYIPGYDLEELSNLAIRIGFKGIGIAERFLHVDVRTGALTVWKYPKKK